MGVVYEAIRETENFTQKVALKVIKRGMNNEIILKRFHSEQQILATLEHHNIGRFLDGGKTADGLPFYAMELIEGVAIDDYCRQNHSTIPEKVKIFREVCSAVSYAHTNLIVHRDLKPSNIIVTKHGTPKLLDFGIAKVLDVDSKEVGTATQLGMMTPQYASPEQIRGEKVTTLSDPQNIKRLFQLAMLYIRSGDSIGGLDNRDSLLQKLEYHLKALTFADELYRADTQNPESLRMLARANQRIGTDYFWLGENAEMNNLSERDQSFFKQALPYHEKMFETIEQLANIIPDDPNVMRNLFASHSSFAETLSRNSRKQEALELAETAMTLAKRM
jgi:serine/threonine protein kinase